MNQPQTLSYTPRDQVHTEPGAIRFVIVVLAVLFLIVFVVLPLVVVFAQAFSKGVSAYFAALAEPEALSAIRLTLLIAAIIKLTSPGPVLYKSPRVGRGGRYFTFLKFRSMRIAQVDLKLTELHVVHAGDTSFPLSGEITAVALQDLMSAVKPLD